MIPWVVGLPEWVLAGLLLGSAGAALVAVAFLFGAWAFPDRPRPSGPDGGETRRRAEIRRYLTEIDEPFVEDGHIAGRSAAFVLPDRGVAITFDARDYFLFERAGVEAVLVEYEMPGWLLGHRLPFKVPPVERTERQRETAFAALGLPPTASLDEVREAYRDRVKAVHPDHGGDPDAFHRVREAYAAAKKQAE